MWCKKSLGIEIVREKFESSAISKRQFQKNLIPFTFSHSLIPLLCPGSSRSSVSRQDAARHRIELRNERESRAGNVSTVLSRLSAGTIHTPHSFIVSSDAYLVQADRQKKAGLATPIQVFPSAKRYDSGVDIFRIWSTSWLIAIWCTSLQRRTIDELLISFAVAAALSYRGMHTQNRNAPILNRFDSWMFRREAARKRLC